MQYIPSIGTSACIYCSGCRQAAAVVEPAVSMCRRHCGGCFSAPHRWGGDTPACFGGGLIAAVMQLRWLSSTCMKHTSPSQTSCNSCTWADVLRVLSRFACHSSGYQRPCGADKNVCPGQKLGWRVVVLCINHVITRHGCNVVPSSQARVALFA